MVANHRVCIQQQGIYSNKVITICGQLWERTKNGLHIRKKRKNVKAEEFAKEMKDRHEETKAALVKSQEEMKR